MEWSGLATQMTSIITTFTIVGGALIWVYKKLVSDPDKRLAEKIQRENSEAAKEMQRESAESLRTSVEPLTKSIDLLNRNLTDSAKDREQLNKKVSQHGIVLNNHETRISVLEDWKGGSK